MDTSRTLDVNFSYATGQKKGQVSPGSIAAV